MTLSWAIEQATLTPSIIGGKHVQKFTPIKDLNPWIKFKKSSEPVNIMALLEGDK